MHLELTQEAPCWVVVNGAAGRMIASIKAGVRPHSFRKWDPATQTWAVHYRWLSWVVTVARGLGCTLDWSALPDAWQMLAVGAQEAPGATLEDGHVQTPSNPHEALYVAEDAPVEVVKAAYRALVHKYHPDQGGNEADFRRVDEAYRAVMKLRQGIF